MPGEGLEPSRGKPSQDFKSCAFLWNPYLPKVYVLPLTQCSPKMLNLNGLEGTHQLAYILIRKIDGVRLPSIKLRHIRVANSSPQQVVEALNASSKSHLAI